jgi:F-box-like
LIAEMKPEIIDQGANNHNHVRLIGGAESASQNIMLKVPDEIAELPESLRAHMAMLIIGTLQPSYIAKISAHTDRLTKKDFLKDLPYEIAIKTMEFTDHKTLGRAALVSSTWKSVVSDTLLWKSIYCSQGWSIVSFDLSQNELFLKRLSRPSYDEHQSEEPTLSSWPLATSQSTGLVNVQRSSSLSINVSANLHRHIILQCRNYMVMAHFRVDDIILDPRFL